VSGCGGAEEREAELLPVPYLPSAIGDIAYQNKRVIYEPLFKASAEAMLTIAADKRRLGARIAITSVLHTWGSAMTHHPHVHMIVPGGGLSAEAKRWIAAKSRFFLPARVLSKLFRRLMLEKLAVSHKRGKLTFFGEHAPLADPKAFAQFLKPLKRTRWFVSQSAHLRARRPRSPISRATPSRCYAFLPTNAPITSSACLSSVGATVRAKSMRAPLKQASEVI